MVVLDNLVVTNALPSIRLDLGATIGSLEWTVNAYTLAYAVLLLAVLATVFSSTGSYASPVAYVEGMTSAAWVGAAVLALGALIALLVPGRGRPAAQASVAPSVNAQPA
jgi:hypothetical protein